MKTEGIYAPRRNLNRNSSRRAGQASRKSQPQNVRLGIFLTEADSGTLDEEANANALSVSAYLRILVARGRQALLAEAEEARSGTPSQQDALAATPETGGGPEIDRVARQGPGKSDQTLVRFGARQPKTRRRQASRPFTRNYRPPSKPSRSRARKIASNAPGGPRRGRPRIQTQAFASHGTALPQQNPHVVLLCPRKLACGQLAGRDGFA